MLRAVCFLHSVRKASCTSAFLCTESQLYVCLPPSCTESQSHTSALLLPVQKARVIHLPYSSLYRKPESYICLTPSCTESQSYICLTPPCTESQSHTSALLLPVQKARVIHLPYSSLYRKSRVVRLPSSSVQKSRVVHLPSSSVQKSRVVHLPYSSLYRKSESYVCLPPLYRNPESYVCPPPLYRNPESYVCLPPLYRNPESYVYGAPSPPVPHGFFGTARRGKGMDLFRGVHHRRLDKGGIIVLGHCSLRYCRVTQEAALPFFCLVFPSSLPSCLRSAVVPLSGGAVIGQGFFFFFPFSCY